MTFNSIINRKGSFHWYDTLTITMYRCPIKRLIVITH
jgi:hypothetical protein